MGDVAVRFRSPAAVGEYLAGRAGSPVEESAAPATGPLDELLTQPSLPLSALAQPLRRLLPVLIHDLALPLVIRDGRVSWCEGARSQADELDAGRIAGVLAAHVPAAARHQAARCQIHTCLLVDSTNTVLMRAATAGARTPQVLLAHCQSAGRGRHQRAWHGRWGEAIQLSVLVDSGRTLAQLSGLPLAAGVAVARALAELTGLPPGPAGIGLKWPNDLVHGSGKLGGLLVETAGSTESGARAVIGLGLNWLAPASLQAAAGQPVAALAGLPGIDGIDRAEVAGRVLAHLLAALQQFQDEGLAPFLAGFQAFDVLAGQPVRVIAGNADAVDGVALGLAGDGALRVRHGVHERCYHSAEVSVRRA